MIEPLDFSSTSFERRDEIIGITRPLATAFIITVITKTTVFLVINIIRNVPIDIKRANDKTFLSPYLRANLGIIKTWVITPIMPTTVKIRAIFDASRLRILIVKGWKA